MKNTTLKKHIQLIEGVGDLNAQDRNLIKKIVDASGGDTNIIAACMQAKASEKKSGPVVEMLDEASSDEDTWENSFKVAGRPYFWIETDIVKIFQSLNLNELDLDRMEETGLSIEYDELLEALKYDLGYNDSETREAATAIMSYLKWLGWEVYNIPESVLRRGTSRKKVPFFQKIKNAFSTESLDTDRCDICGGELEEDLNGNCCCCRCGQCYNNYGLRIASPCVTEKSEFSNIWETLSSLKSSKLQESSGGFSVEGYVDAKYGKEREAFHCNTEAEAKQKAYELQEEGYEDVKIVPIGYSK